MADGKVFCECAPCRTFRGEMTDLNHYTLSCCRRAEPAFLPWGDADIDSKFPRRFWGTVEAAEWGDE